MSTCPVCQEPAHSWECSYSAIMARIESESAMVAKLTGDVASLEESTGLLYADREVLWKVVRDSCAVLRVTDDDEADWPKLTSAVTVLVQERDTLRAQLTDRQRLYDLVRHQRGPLHDAGLISDEEYAALAGDHGAVARLEGYDELRAKLAEAEATLLNERGEGEPPEEGWRWYVSGQVREWRRGSERVIQAHPGKWESHAPGRERLTRATARAAIEAAKLARGGT